MRRLFLLAVDEVVPSGDAVLHSQGLPVGAALPAKHRALLDAAMELYGKLAEPRGVYAEVSRAEFEIVYQGQGRNEPNTPLELIFPRARRLALFVMTVGNGVSHEIARLFRENEPALGYMLDAVASQGTDLAAHRGARLFQGSLMAELSASNESSVLPYSPGYCGWHISGQRELFDALRPEEIGVSLGSSFLMQPLKSVSGVFVAGERSIHDFRIAYSFCKQCATHPCRERIRSVLVE